MYGHDELEMLENGSGSGCGCFQSLWGRSRNSNNNGDQNDQSYLLQERGEQHNDHQVWVVKQLKKLKEVSELIAGPKWKNFVRRIGAYFNNKIRKNKRRDFGYDSYDYALNFDDGNHGDNEDEFGGGIGFSSRFAPPVSEKTKPSYL